MMGLNVGSITVNADGTHTGVGLVGDLVTSLIAIDKSGLYDPTTPAGWYLQIHRRAGESDVDIARGWRVDVGSRKRDMAAGLTAWAGPIVSQIASAVVSVLVSAGGLQTTPNPNLAATATGAPAAPVTLTGTLA